MDLRRLRKDDDRSAFSCGDPDLDDYFHDRAGQSQFKQRTSVTYVVADPVTNAIAGFVTVMPGTVRREEIGVGGRLPPVPLPILLLARMGVSSSLQRAGLGQLLLSKVMRLAVDMARDLGCVGVIVDAKPTARGFYERFDFAWLNTESSDGIVRGFLPTRTIEAALPIATTE